MFVYTRYCVMYVMSFCTYVMKLWDCVRVCALAGQLVFGMSACMSDL